MSSSLYQVLIFFFFYTAARAPYREGDIMLGGLFNVHQQPENPGSQCGEINLRGLGRTQAMIFAIERINNSTSLLSNFSLGYDIRDYCENVSKAAELVYKLLTVDSCVKFKQNNTGKNAIISLVGPDESRTAMVIGGFLQMLNFSSISGTTTSAELSSPTYNHLHRTAPSDTFLATAMVDLVTHFNWSYIAIVGLDDSYGRNGVWAVVSESTSRKDSFCIALTEFIRPESLNLSSFNIVKKLKQMQNIKVVILWLYEYFQRNFFAEVHRQNLTGRVWILSADFFRYKYQRKDILESSIAFQHHNFGNFGFKEHLKDILVKKRNNKSFSEWSDGANEIWHTLASKKCVNGQIEQCSEDLIEEIYSSYIPYTIDAVYALAHAINISTRDFSRNNFNTNPDKSPAVNDFDLQKLLRRVNFDGLTGKIKFDRFGDRGSAHYDIVIFKDVHKENVKSFKKVLVGEWESSIENKTALIFHEDLHWNTPSGRPPISECSELCPPGTRQSATSPCCWQCFPCLGGTISPSAGSKTCTECPNGTMSNQAKTECVALPSANINYDTASGILILAFAALGVVVTILCLFALSRFWNSPIIKASNRELSLVLLLTILSLLSLAVINVFKTTDAICKVIYPLRYVTYSLCLSVVLVKVLLISSAFQTPIVDSLIINSLPKKAQVAIVIAFLVPLLAVLLPWLLLDPPYNMQHINPKRYTFNECKAYSSLVGILLFRPEVNDLSHLRAEVTQFSFGSSGVRVNSG
ncbi:Metabotropic glutamate receptor 4 [Stylophora pistillata]|uniref:Metabotropic glutamate receptor 4 n=1 Tax=Stylophora pistillata TaxID=50429 RepID=A0A2B4SZE0_STYPI|nr:Metabotropic glutamate receptor 4 [Stylophora pistillata]